MECEELTTDDGKLVRVDEGPSGGVMSALGSVQEAHEWHNKGVVSCRSISELAYKRD